MNPYILLAISMTACLLGILFGAVTVTQQIFSMKAIETGPWSYTSVITSLSTIIPTLSGVLLFSETISVVQIIALPLLSCSAIRSNTQRIRCNLQRTLFLTGAK